MSSERKRPPTVAAGDNGTFVILQSDGAAASFVNERWRPGIAFASRDFLDMSDCGQGELAVKLLAEASEALARSRDQYEMSFAQDETRSNTNRPGGSFSGLKKSNDNPIRKKFNGS
jgi:hypothetical protein